MSTTALNSCTKAPNYDSVKQETVRKISQNFFSRVNEGQDKSNALKEAIENFDKKVNPKEDNFKGSVEANYFKGMSPAEAAGWVGLITTIVELGFKVWDGIGERLPKPQKTTEN